MLNRQNNIIGMYYIVHRSMWYSNRYDFLTNIIILLLLLYFRRVGKVFKVHSI